MIGDEPNLRDVIFAELVSRDSLKRGGASLAELNGQPLSNPSNFRSSLIDRWEIAWTKPLNQLTCQEVRCLFGQGDGMPWLADPIAEFVARFPDAETDFYPGDMTVEVLRRFDLVSAASAEAGKKIASLDLADLIESFAYDRSFRREVETLYEEVRSRSDG